MRKEGEVWHTFICTGVWASDSLNTNGDHTLCTSGSSTSKLYESHDSHMMDLPCNDRSE